MLANSSFDPDTGVVQLPAALFGQDAAAIKRAAFHEMAHAVEAGNPALLKRQLAWVKGRSSAKAPGFVQSGLDPDDIMDGIYPDEFTNTYVGRVYEFPTTKATPDEIWADVERMEMGKARKLTYKEAATETISVGTEYLVDPIARAELLARDPDHFDLILSLTKEVPR